ncbi:MAG: type IV pili methyl-accepting chemotaxis transducer N-terminal domain-containing protein, partial [Granulosicoccaceae bacterium]
MKNINIDISKYLKLDKLKGGGLLQLLAVSIAAVFIALVVTIVINYQRGAYDNDYLTIAGEQRVLSQTMTSFALEASRGDEIAFNRLQYFRNEFDSRSKAFNEGDPERGFAPSPVEMQDQLAAVNGTWNEYRENVDTILARKDAILSLGSSVQDIADNIPNLLALSDEVVGILIEQGASPQQIYIASRQLMLTQRIANNVTRVLQGGQGAATAADRFGRDTALFGRVHRGMLNGDRILRISAVTDIDARDKLEEVGEVFTIISDLVGKVLESSPEMFLVHDAADKISASSGLLLGNLTSLVEYYNNKIGQRVLPYITVVLAVVLFVLLVLLAYTLISEARRRTGEAEAASRRNQEAIMRLLNEMGDLADGDL